MALVPYEKPQTGPFGKQSNTDTLDIWGPEEPVIMTAEEWERAEYQRQRTQELHQKMDSMFSFYQLKLNERLSITMRACAGDFLVRDGSPFPASEDQIPYDDIRPYNEIKKFFGYLWNQACKKENNSLLQNLYNCGTFTEQIQNLMLGYAQIQSELPVNSVLKSLNTHFGSEYGTSTAIKKQVLNILQQRQHAYAEDYGKMLTELKEIERQLR